MADPTAPPPDDRVHVVDPQGQLMTVPAAQLQAARAQGYQLASPETIEQQRPTTFTDVLRGAQALDESLLRGATAGLSDPLINKLASVLAPVVNSEFVGRSQEEIERQFGQETQALQAEHPTLTGIGEIGGMVGGTLLGGGLARGLGAAAEGGSFLARAGQFVNEIAPLRAIESVGGAAEGLAGAGVEGLATRGVLGRAASTGIKLAARGATEMGVYSGVRELSEEMLGDPAINGEKILAASLDGAEGGALFGLALGAGGSLAASGARGLQGIAVNAASKSADYLQSAANEQRWRALDPLKKYTKEVETRVKGGVNTAGEVLGEYGITGRTLQEAVQKGDIESIASRVDSAVDQVGQRIGEMQAGSMARIPIQKIDDAINEVLAPIRKKGGFEGIERSVEAYRTSLLQKLVPEDLRARAFVGDPEAIAALPKLTVPIQDAIFQRKALDELVYKESKALDPQLRVSLLRDFRGKFENLIVDHFDEAAKASGNAEAKAELLKLKRDYQILSIAQNATEDATSRMVTNRNLSLSDYMSGGFASHVGSAVGGFIAGAPGAAVGAALGGAGGALANRYLRKSGNAIAANLLDRAASMGNASHVASAEMVQKAADFQRAIHAITSVDAAIARAATGIVEGPRETSGKRLSASNPEQTIKQFDRVMSRISAVQSNPDAILRGASEPLANLPMTSQHMTVAMTRTASFLGQAGPAPATNPTLGQSLMQHFSMADMQRTIERGQVAANPMAAFRAIAQGSATVVQAQALREVSPALFAQLQAQTLRLVATKQAAGDPVTFDARQRMHIYLGILTDPSQSPKMLAQLQANLAPLEGGQGQGPSAKQPTSPKRGVEFQDFTSKLDKMETK